MKLWYWHYASKTEWYNGYKILIDWIISNLVKFLKVTFCFGECYKSTLLFLEIKVKIGYQINVFSYF
jgi:hypothetical protein